VHAEVFDVDVAAEARIEQQIPAGVMIVVVDINAVAIPIPVTAAGQIVGSHNPVGIVVESDAARAGVKVTGGDVDLYVLVAAERVRAAGTDAVMLGVPIRVRIALAV